LRFGDSRTQGAVPRTSPRYLLGGRGAKRKSDESAPDAVGERREERVLPTEDALEERTDARTESRVSGLMYSRSRLEKRSSIALESGLRGGDISGRSRVYLVPHHPTT